MELKKKSCLGVFLELTLPKTNVFAENGCFFKLLFTGVSCWLQGGHFPTESPGSTLEFPCNPGNAHDGHSLRARGFLQGCHLLIFARKSNEGNGGMEKSKECLEKQSKSNFQNTLQEMFDSFWQSKPKGRSLGEKNHQGA